MVVVELNNIDWAFQPQLINKWRMYSEKNHEFSSVFKSYNYVSVKSVFRFMNFSSFKLFSSQIIVYLLMQNAFT